MDGSSSQIVLPNLTPGVTYKVTVIAIKGQRESEPGSDSVTTGKIHTHTHIRNAKNRFVGHNSIRHYIITMI